MNKYFIYLFFQSSTQEIDMEFWEKWQMRHYFLCGVLMPIYLFIHLPCRKLLSRKRSAIWSLIFVSNSSSVTKQTTVCIFSLCLVENCHIIFLSAFKSGKYIFKICPWVCAHAHACTMATINRSRKTQNNVLFAAFSLTPVFEEGNIFANHKQSSLIWERLAPFPWCTILNHILC